MYLIVAILLYTNIIKMLFQFYFNFDFVILFYSLGFYIISTAI